MSLSRIASVHDLSSIDSSGPNEIHEWKTGLNSRTLWGRRVCVSQWECISMMGGIDAVRQWGFGDFCSNGCLHSFSSESKRKLLPHSNGLSQCLVPSRASGRAIPTTVGTIFRLTSPGDFNLIMRYCLSNLQSSKASIKCRLTKCNAGAWVWRIVWR